MTAETKALQYGVVLAAGVVLSLSIGLRANIPCWNDEGTFLKAAEMLKSTGSLVSKTTETNLAGRTVKWHALWHPPLYLSMLAPLGHDPFRPISARLLSVACWLACLFMAIKGTTRTQTDWQNNRWVACALLALLQLSIPAVADGMLYIDIDTSVLAVAVVAFVVNFVRMPERSFGFNIASTAILTAFLFWSKLTTPPFLLVASCVVAALYRKWRVLSAVIVGACLGTVLFVGSLLLYCYATEADVRLMLSMYTSKGGASLFAWLRTPGVLLNSIYVNVVWSSIWFLILIAVAVGLRFRRGCQRLPETWRADSFWVCGTIIWLMYPICFQTTHPKYIYPSLLLLSACAYERLISASVSERATARLNIAVGAGIGMLGIAAFQIPSLCFQNSWPQLKGLRALDLLKVPEVSRLLVYLGLIVLGLIAPFLWKRLTLVRFDHFGKLCLWSMFVGCLLFGVSDLGFAIWKDDAFSPLNRQYQSGFMEAVATLRRMPPKLNVVYSRTSSFYTGGTLINLSAGQDVFLREWSADDVRNYGLGLLSEKKLDVCVDSLRFPESLILMRDCINAGMHIRTFNDYYVASFEPVEKLMGPGVDTLRKGSNHEKEAQKKREDSSLIGAELSATFPF